MKLFSLLFFFIISHQLKASGIISYSDAIKSLGYVQESPKVEICPEVKTSDQTIASINWIAQKFTVSAAGRLTKVELNLKNFTLNFRNVL